MNAECTRGHYHHPVLWEYTRHDELRWVFKYMDFWKPCRKHKILLCACAETKFSKATWAEGDNQKAQKFVCDYWEKFFRLKDADCSNCGEPHPYAYELCTGCQIDADIQAGRLKFTTNRAGDTILVPVPRVKAVV